MPAPNLVVLAAGMSTRFGGLKQLAPVRPNGDAIVDVLLERAATAGFGTALVVVRREIERDVESHFAAGRAPALPVELVVQAPVPGRAGSPGTAHAVLGCREALAGSFAVVNADDLYPGDAFALLARHLRSAPDNEHAFVAFPARGTLIGSRPVTRALVELDAGAWLITMHEGTVTPGLDELRFDAPGISLSLGREAWVSMNMWGLQPSIFETLERAVAEYVAADDAGEVRLPDVVASLVASGGTVKVLQCDAPCIGITHPEDLSVVAAALA
jgi:bifunctional N-acetylglucosamine-1-phosphate-uridyltransferase/glucosamine-1-phosphate-acetyltransferase GlmU-like protein